MYKTIEQIIYLAITLLNANVGTDFPVKNFVLSRVYFFWYWNAHFYQTTVFYILYSIMTHFSFYFSKKQERLQSKRFTKTATNSLHWYEKLQHLMSVAWASKFYRLQSKMFTMMCNICNRWARHKQLVSNEMLILGSLKPIGKNSAQKLPFLELFSNFRIT